MIKVETAKQAGFCFGVERAVKTVEEEIKKQESGDASGTIYTFGPIIHNDTVTGYFDSKGVRVVESADELDKATDGTVIIRSHGISRDIQDKLGKTGLSIIDATCPFVTKIHKIVEEYSKNGYEIVVIGDASHPEVEGTVGWCVGKPATVIGTREEAQEFASSPHGKICIVSQTTFMHNKFKEFVEILTEKAYYNNDAQNAVVCDTICSATNERQESAEALAARSDAMIVIGGKSSSNTRKLYEICKNKCKNTYFIQTKEDLPEEDFSRFDSVGITAGASTPKNIIEEVQNYVRNEF